MRFTSRRSGTAVQPCATNGHIERCWCKMTYTRFFPEATPCVIFAWSPPVRDRSMPIREGPTARWLASARSSTGWTAGGTHHWGVDVVSGNKRAYVLLTPTPLDVYDEPWWWLVFPRRPISHAPRNRPIPRAKRQTQRRCPFAQRYGLRQLADQPPKTSRFASD